MRRSVVLAAASALAAAAVLSPPAAAGTGDPLPGAAVVFNNGNGNVTNFGNANNAAGRDNLVGSGHTAGTGHTIGGLQPLTPACTTAPCTFNYTGDVQRFTVPPGVIALVVRMTGAAGGRAWGLPGGRGAEVTVPALSVTPGQTLYLYVGGSPTAPPGTCFLDWQCGGGFNGGGLSVGGYAGGGGGASDIRTSEGDLSTRLVVAAGGGGVGAQSGCTGQSGHAGGDAGMPGTGVICIGNPAGGGGAGTQTAGGVGGTADSPGNHGQAGGLGTGGQGASGVGGGGGGGYYGGGGGGAQDAGGDGGGGGGGGGGSSFLPAFSSSQLATSPTGSITINW
ncbi:glycine-rich protein [Streptomyces erythrochromogenes]|uniref:glycine-rich protein n=1 Tax=Streptomyces erythrochromogenes TaxID=285574 RepID=UPI003432FE06